MTNDPISIAVITFFSTCAATLTSGIITAFYAHHLSKKLQDSQHQFEVKQSEETQKFQNDLTTNALAVFKEFRDMINSRAARGEFGRSEHK